MSVYIPEDRGGYYCFRVSCDNPTSVDEVRIAEPEVRPQERGKPAQGKCVHCGAWYERTRNVQKYCSPDCSDEAARIKDKNRKKTR